MEIKKEKILKLLFDASRYIYKERDSFIGQKEKDNSTTITFKEGDLSFNDNFFGGEPFGGREIVSYKEKPVWMMVYYGWVENGIDIKEVYSLLIKAFRKTALKEPFRGPKRYILGEWEYKNKVTGDVKSLEGFETICKNGKVVFTTKYVGGWVDKR